MNKEAAGIARKAVQDVEQETGELGVSLCLHFAHYGNDLIGGFQVVRGMSLGP